MPKLHGNPPPTQQNGQELDCGEDLPVKTSRKLSPMIYFDILCVDWMMSYYTSMMKSLSKHQNPKS